MQNNDGSSSPREGAMQQLHQACAACKHQRKKCADNCVLAPFFPVEKLNEFQAVHKVFGVSNIQKILRSLDTNEKRINAVNSIIWEALWRQTDPVNGCYGEYVKVYNELHRMKTKLDNMYKSVRGLTGWNNDYGMTIGDLGIIDSNTINYIHRNGSLLLESNPCNFGSQIQGQEKENIERDPLGIVGPPQSINGLDQHYYLTDQFNRTNVKTMDDTIWSEGT